ncbi:MAG: CPBP family intramembrane metalloprotease [Planctomycetales bacterium]|nr:CPBP family intramembrane metalloprotease [Planctomycetales bacterium]
MNEIPSVQSDAPKGFDPANIDAELLQQNPLLMLLILAFGAGCLLLLSGSLASWLYLAIRRVQGKPILEVERWQPTVWGLADVLFVVFFVFVGQYIAAIVASALLQVELAAENGAAALELAALGSLANLSVIVVTLCWLSLRYGIGPTHVGFTRDLWKVIKIGVLAGLVIIPVIYLGNFLVALQFEVDYKHPLLEALKSKATLSSYVLAVFAAAVAAPITEEFFFRGMLQGWLQSIPFSSGPAMIIGAPHHQRSDPDNQLFYRPVAGPAVTTNANLQPTLLPVDTISTSTQEPTTDDSMPLQEDSEHPILDQSSNTGDVIPPIWPSVIAGILFGLAHWGYGLSFIPLSVLGIFLGLLYRATHSLWPCILVHFMLNSSSMIALGFILLCDHIAGK